MVVVQGMPICALSGRRGAHFFRLFATGTVGTRTHTCPRATTLIYPCTSSRDPFVGRKHRPVGNRTGARAYRSRAPRFRSPSPTSSGRFAASGAVSAFINDCSMSDDTRGRAAHAVASGDLGGDGGLGAVEVRPQRVDVDLGHRPAFCSGRRGRAVESTASMLTTAFGASGWK